MYQINKHLEETKMAVDDLTKLSNWDNYPIIARLNYHLNKIKEKSDLNLNSFFIQSIDSVIEQFVSKYLSIKTYKKSVDINKFKVDQTSRVSIVLPKLLSLIKLTKGSGPLLLELNERYLSVSTVFENIEQIASCASKVVSKSRELFKMGVLLTYKVQKINSSHTFTFTFIADISLDKRLLYTSILEGRKQISLSFPNVIENYIVENESFKMMACHKIFEILDDCRLVKHECLAKDLNFKKDKSQIIHFHFIFQPISIIIPLGKIVVRDEIPNNKTTGSGYQANDFFNEKFKLFGGDGTKIFMDIFSFLS